MNATSHEPYIHQEDRVSSLLCTCGQWKGRHLVDNAGHTEHVASLHCSVCGDPADTDPCSPECRNDLALIEGHYCDTPQED